MEVAGGDKDGDVEAWCECLDRREVEVREREIGARELQLERVSACDVDRHAVSLCVPRGGFGGGRLAVDSDDRAEAELCRSDRQNSRAAADVEHAAAFSLEQQPKTESRGRVRAGAERASGVYDHGDHVAGRLLPGRADPERADPDRTVEVA